MEENRFEIKIYSDYSRRYKINYLLGIFIISFLSFAKIYDDDFHWHSWGFVLLLLMFIIRLFFPRICWQKYHVSFLENKVSFLTSECVCGTTYIKYSDIKNIEIKENFILLYTGTTNRKRKLRLKTFSDSLKHKIRDNFEKLKSELN